MTKPMQDQIANLTFVATRRRGAGGKLPRNFWAVKPTGNGFADVAWGEALGQEYLKYSARQDRSISPDILPCIVADMPKDLTQLEIGFLTAIGAAATAGAQSGKR